MARVLVGSEAQMISYVGWAATMVWSLPELASENSPLPGVARNACLESFLMNVRLVTEFLVKGSRRRDDRDFCALDVAPGWKPQPEDAARRLYDWDQPADQQGWWWLASQQVVHLSRRRVQEDPSNPTYVDTSLAGLSAIREDVRVVWQCWEPYMQSAVSERWQRLRTDDPAAGQ